MATLDKLVDIQKLSNRASGEYSSHMKLHAEVNQKRSNVRSTDGSERTEYSMAFKVRWNPLISGMQHDLQSYRLVWDGAVYHITAFDDYKQQHRYVTITGQCDGV